MESEAKALKAQAIHKKRPMNHAARQLSTVQTIPKRALNQNQFLSKLNPSKQSEFLSNAFPNPPIQSKAFQ